MKDKTYKLWIYRWNIKHDDENKENWRFWMLKILLEWEIIDDTPHYSDNRKNQRILWVEIENQIYLLPYVQDEENEWWFFIKTAFPCSRKTKNL